MVTQAQLKEKAEGIWGKFAFLSAEDRIALHILNMLHLNYPIPRIQQELEKRKESERNPDRRKVINYFLNYIDKGETKA